MGSVSCCDSEAKEKQLVFDSIFHTPKGQTMLSNVKPSTISHAAAKRMNLKLYEEIKDIKWEDMTEEQRWMKLKSKAYLRKGTKCYLYQSEKFNR